ncbi:MAG: flagellar export chaperone FlgN [Betaproteobacteria bacterium]|nr:flagellar export chaperone FlgN [Betaproteobacteria bacterium]
MTPLESDLSALSQAMTIFVSIMREEAEALAAADSARLDTLLPRRGEAQARISQSWQNLTSRLNLPAHTAMAELRQHVFPGQAPESWSHLEKLAQEGSRLNQVNSQLIDEQMRRTQAALQVLHNAASRRGLYGSDGRIANVLNTSRNIDTV